MSETLTVSIYPDAEAIHDGVPQVFEGVKYVSLVNHNTFGPPALIAPPPKAKEGEIPKAKPGDDVLYVNTSLVPAFIIARNG